MGIINTKPLGISYIHLAYGAYCNNYIITES